jgi:DNA-binding CsgD family transcriptional regulator
MPTLAELWEIIRTLTRENRRLRRKLRGLDARQLDARAPFARPLLVAPYLPENSVPASQPLTQREKEVARLICHGFTSEVIAERLSIQYDSVRKHRQHIKAKVGVSDRAGLEQRREEWDTEP